MPANNQATKERATNGSATILGHRLSLQQERLWLLQSDTPRQTYRVTCSVSIRKALADQRLEAAIKRVVERHEILRTDFCLLAGMSTPLQVIDEHEFQSRKLLQRISEPEQGAAGDADALSTVNPAMFCLVSRSAHEHRLLISLSPLCADLPSLQALVDEIREEYEGSGRPLAWRPAIQYADYAEWQLEVLGSVDDEVRLSQRRSHDYTGLQQAALLWRNNNAFASSAFSPRRQVIRLDAAGLTAIESTASQLQTCVKDVILACWEVFLWRLDHRGEELQLALACNARIYAVLRETIGNMTMTVPYRRQFQAGMTFADAAYLAQETRSRIEESLEYFSWSEVTGGCQHRAISYPSLVFEFIQDQAIDPGRDFAFSLHQAEAFVERFDLKLAARQTGLEIELELQYNSSRLAHDYVEYLSRSFGALLGSISNDTKARIEDLCMFHDLDLRRLLDGGAEQHTAASACIHRVFEDQVKRSPESLAVADENSRLTYRELNARANRLAGVLGRLGVQPEDKVALNLPRSVEFVVALLGVWKAGAAYVPLDPNWPVERTSWILRDAVIRVLVTHSQFEADAFAGMAHVVYVNRQQALTENDDRNRTVAVALSNLAYVIFTSGSTGTPKGVGVEHAQVHSYLQGISARLPLHEKLSFATVSTFAADLGNTMIFSALCSGGVLHILSEQSILAPESLAAYCRRNPIDCLKIVPSHLNALLSGAESDALLPKRYLILGGEALSWELAARLGDVPRPLKILNHYGPSETTIGVLTCSPDDLPGERYGSTVPIGRPLNGSRVYVLDQYGAPVPIGTTGELYIGGGNVSRGYLGRADQTAERFLPDPFSSYPGARLYRSGDEARSWPDGNIEFLGRSDDQIKVHGFRVEPGEIESHLLQHLAIRNAAVTAREDVAGDKRLVAYLVRKNGLTVKPSEIREFLNERLPEPMVPRFYVFLDKLPLNANGKLDRRGLPAPESVLPELTPSYASPRTREEQTLAGIWAEVLGLERTGIDDNFFALGGDSIRSIRMRSKLQEQGLSFQLPDLFRYPTIRQLAPSLRSSTSEEPALRPVEPFSMISASDRKQLPPHVEDCYPLASLQMGMFFHDLYSPDRAMYLDITSLHLQGTWDQARMERALADTMNRHPALRTAFDFSAFEQPLQMVYRTVPVPLQVDDLRHLSFAEQEDAVAKWLESERERKFDWGVAPMYRVHIHLRSSDAFQFTFSRHHAILDGWSFAAATTETFERYLNPEEKAEEHQRPPVTSNFADFIAMEREALTSSQSRAYWLSALDEESPSPLFGPEGNLQAAPHDSVRKLAVSLDMDTSEDIKTVARESGVHVKTVLLAAHVRVLSLFNGQEKVTTGLVTHGRSESGDGDRVLGLFLNTLPLQIDVHSKSWRELIAACYEAEQNLFPHRHYPLAAVQNLLGRRSLFEAAFMYLHFHVYSGLSSYQDKLRPVSVTNFQETNFPWVAEFGQDPFSSRLQLQIYLEASVFSAEQANAIATYYQRALQNLGSKPNSYCDNQTLFDERERGLLLQGMQGERRLFSSPRNLLHLFAEQVVRSPNEIAVVADDRHWTYDELDRQSDRVGQHLIRRGIRAEDTIGICLERSLDMVAALLGVLKTGAAYVPLDPNYPEERLRYMLADARIRLVLTERRLRSILACDAMQFALLDELDPSGSEKIPYAAIEPQSLAYVIYTSGSTGAPKGVAVRHDALFNLLLAMQAKLRPTIGDRWLAVTTLAFDIAALELYLPLMTGAQLWVAGTEEVKDSSRLRGRLMEAAITILQATPITWKLLLEAGPLPDSLRLGLCGGEAIDQKLSRELCASSTLEVWNVYGPTETTIWSTMQRLKSGEKTIGLPIDHTDVYILDTALQLVPAGVAGELYIGGAGLARGYMNRPDMTAERFLANPFSSSPGERLYRTGDLVRWSPEGNLEYLGRLDQQVKIRGFRIELGEIEAALLKHPGVCGAVAAAWKDGTGEQRLAAYIVARDEVHLNCQDIRESLKRNLPEYMVPAVLVKVAAIPLTANGKIDRKALPKIDDGTRLSEETRYAPPQTEDQSALIEIWQQVLGIERAGIDDNFFALGGDSILSLRVVTRARERGIRFTLAQLFEHRTVRQLLSKISRLEGPGPRELPAPFAMVAGSDRVKLAAGIVDAYPLTRLQAGMLYHGDLDPGTYQNAHSFRLRGMLEEASLRAALSQLVAAHVTLRTSFDLSSYSEPLQLVHAQAEPALQISDLQQLSEEVRERQAARILAAEKVKRIDVDKPALFRLHLIRLRPDQSEFILVQRHAILDGWSVAVLLMELLERYRAHTENRSYEQAPDSAGMREFVRNERDALSSESQQQFWSARLDDFKLSVLPAHMGSYVVREELEVPISSELSDGLKRTAKESGLPIKSVLLAVHLRVIGLVAGSYDVTTGMVVNGRPEGREAERAFGLFLNTIPFRLQLVQESWRDLAGRVFRADLEVLSRRCYPAATLQLMTGGQRLFETSFNFTHFHVFNLLHEMEGVEVTAAQSDVPTNIPLTANFRLDNVSQKLALTLVMEGGRLGKEQLEALSHLYQRALQQMAHKPGENCPNLTLLHDGEGSHLPREWQGEAITYGPGNNLVELLETQMERAPDATAVVSEGLSLTYRELHERSNQLAHYLRKAGLHEEGVVGVALDRSIELVVTLLAITKAGGAYLPLDPEYPADRRKYMLRQSGATLLVLDQNEQGAWAEDGTNDLTVIDLGEHTELIRAQSRSRLYPNLDGENLAYVIYTSGSTGRPKGAMNTHRGIYNRLLWMQRAYRLAPEDRVLQKTPYSFDVSVWEFFWPLIAGAGLVLTRPGGHRDARYLADLIQREGITTIHFVPSMLTGFLEEPLLQQKCRTLGRVICSGEALSRDLAQRARERLQCPVYNLYGPTEAAVDVTAWTTFTQKTAKVQVWEPIGCPIDNIKIHVLDEEMQPVPIGTEGELYIAGDGLARGYVRAPELSAERFVPDPVGKESGQRIYRTGDRGRWHVEGYLEFLGRTDSQIKIRGFRIELAEVEVAMLLLEELAEAVVMAEPDADGDQRLVAYLVAKPRADLKSDVLMRKMRSTLPEHMVPSIFKQLKHLPLTANGKVDRSALSRVEAALLERSTEYAAPRTATEEILASMWATVVKVDKAGIDDDFFHSGGHSLLAAQLIAKVRDTFGVDLSVRALFEASTISALAARIEKQRNTIAVDPPAIEIVPRNGDLALSFAQQRLWFMHRLDAESAFYNVPLGFRIQGALSIEILQRSLFAIAERHEILRSVFPQVEGNPTQRIHSTPAFSFAVRNLEELPIEEREPAAMRLVHEAAVAPFNIERGPLMKVSLFTLGGEDHIAVIVMHHIITDLRSAALLVEELQQCYQAFSKQQTPRLPELTVQFADFAHWERQQVERWEMQSRLQYWRRQLGGDVPAIQWPFPRRQTSAPGFRGADCRSHLSSQNKQDLENLARKEGVTLFMVLLAAYQTFLKHLTNADDIVVATPVDGRTQARTERLIGCFVNMRLLRTELSGDPTFRELLRRVREVALDAEANELPFDIIVRAAKPERAMVRSPFYNVTLTLHNTPQMTGSSFEGISLAPIPLATNTAQCDLVTLLMERDGGLDMLFMYSTDIFDAQTARQMMDQFNAVLSDVVERPDVPISHLSLCSPAQKEQIRMAKRDKFIAFKQSKVEVSAEKLIDAADLQPGQPLPLLLIPNMDDVDLTEWAKANLEWIEQKLRERGGILFRGFSLHSAGDFGKFSTGIYPRTMKYQERSTPRTEVDRDIYTSTEYPAEQAIAMHNEFSYGTTWPMRIWFYCDLAAKQGGQTPIANSRKVYERIDAEIREAFIRKRTMYVRNYGSAIDLPWQTVFQTQSRAEVEAYCRRAPIEWEWLDGDRLRTRQVREAVMRHPQTGEMLWFNQAHLFHLSNLDPEIQSSLLTSFGEENLPRQACYGDGSPIEKEALDAIRRVYAEVAVEFDWQPGDVLLLDNMLVAHGRRPFTGSRRILVAMANPYSISAKAESVRHVS